MGLHPKLTMRKPFYNAAGQTRNGDRKTVITYECVALAAQRSCRAVDDVEDAAEGTVRIDVEEVDNK
jgi:hypothetical protein